MSDIYLAVNPALTPELQEYLTSMWVEVTNAGGAVGFVPPVTVADVRPTATGAFDRVEQGADTLLLLCRQDTQRLPAADDVHQLLRERAELPVAARVDNPSDVLGWLLLIGNSTVLQRHWRTLARVQVTPAARGRGLGRLLMAGAEQVAINEGLRGLSLSVRNGTNTAAFYEKCGFRTIGQRPNSVQIGQRSYVDEIFMWRDLA